jgi:hypothetical protein
MVAPVVRAAVDLLLEIAISECIYLTYELQKAAAGASPTAA